MGKPVEHLLSQICFEYHDEDVQEYMMTYPVLKVRLEDVDEHPFELQWYPSEYLIRQDNRYCVAVDKQYSNEVMLGGTILRQHNLIFDIEKGQLGVVQATCSPDPLQIKK